MLKCVVALALAAGLAVPAMAEAPTLQSRPSLHETPTDEYVPAQTRRLAGARHEDTRLSTIFAPEVPVRRVARTRGRAPTYSYLPAHPSLLSPGSGPPARESRYFYQAPRSAEFDGVPCPTRSRDSLGDLFACTLR